MMRKKEIVSRLQGGSYIHFEYGPQGERCWFLDNTVIRSTQAAKAIADLKMISAGDCLFDGAEPQSWRLP